MTQPTLLSLAGRVESLTGPCRETDARIDCYLRGWTFVAYEKQFSGHIYRWSKGDVSSLEAMVNVQPYTASLDAAMTLVPEDHAFSFRRNCSQDREVVYCNAQVWPYSTPREDVPHSWANSPENAPAIALVAAALKARSALEASHG